MHKPGSVYLSRYILPYIFSKQELNLLDPIKHHSHYDFLVCLSHYFYFSTQMSPPSISIDIQNGDMIVYSISFDLL